MNALGLILLACAALLAYGLRWLARAMHKHMDRRRRAKRVCGPRCGIGADPIEFVKGIVPSKPDTQQPWLYHVGSQLRSTPDR